MLPPTITPAATDLQFKSVRDIVEESELAEEELEAAEYEKQRTFQRSLAGHIISEYHVNESAKRSAGVEKEIMESLQAFNGTYSAKDLAMIHEEGGSSIFMNLTATKCRAAKSWISDILLPAKGKAWTIEPSPSPDLPEEISIKIEAALKKEFLKAAQEGQGNTSIEQAQEDIRTSNQTQRDVKIAIQEEIMKEAKFQMGVMERQIDDQLTEGGFDESLANFIDDFVIYPTAFMKGPIVSKGQKLMWQDGEAVPEEAILFKNKRVDPLDLYPSPSATKITDGNLIEHMRLTRKELSDLRDLESAGYQKKAIDDVLNNSPDTHGSNNWWFNTSIETEKATQELRGNESDANKGIFHAMHFHGSVSAGLLKSWDFRCKGFDPETEDNDVIEVEAILVNNNVIKCAVNTDPLLRRPYYKASFMPRPGAFWGRSLPSLMRDIQRMCNATARALANNLGIASGPQIEVKVDLLASDSDEIEDIRGRQIWQTKSDPTGGGGRAINWFQPSSNAAELLRVYAEFEQRADDVTGIPRYAYGNDKLGGAAATLGGLSMLLESASKIIKSAIKNIDIGVIKPRIEQQFFMNMLANPSSFTGDVTVTPIGSAILSIRAFESMRRNEFLAATANKFDQETMGQEGRADVLRVIAEDLGIKGNPVPTAFEIHRQAAKSAQAAQEQQKLALSEKDKDRQASIAATSVQIEGQERMSNVTQSIKAEDLNRKKTKDQTDAQLKALEISKKDEAFNKELVIKSIKGSGI